MAFDPVVFFKKLKVFEAPGNYLVEDTLIKMNLRIREKYRWQT